MPPTLSIETQLRQLAANVLEQVIQCGTAQKRWASAFQSADKSGIDPWAELSLVHASFPAVFPIEGWYNYFARRSSALLQSREVSLLSAEEYEYFKRLSARCEAFAGTYMVKCDRAPTQAWTRYRKALTIGVDIRPLSVPSSRNRGIGRYLMNTIEQLLELKSQHTFVLLSENGEAVDKELEQRFQCERVEFRQLGKGCDFDLDVFLLTDPCPMLPGRRIESLPISRCPWMSIIYDFIPLEFPELYLLGNTSVLDDYLANIQNVGTRCTAVFPISSYVGIQCERILGFSSDSIVSIGGGVDPIFWNVDKVNYTPPFNGRPYFLYVGGADARKNVATLVASFAAATKCLPADTLLILAGEFTAERVKQLLASLKLSQLEEQVIGLGPVTDEDLCGLYAHACATVFVSLSEGLGLPALEAMSCGCPVIASNGTALSETVGNAALLVNPHSSTEIAEALKSISQNGALRRELSDRGREHSSHWRWKGVASTLLQGIEGHVAEIPQVKRPRTPLRVAMLNRTNVWSAPGGDGRVMAQMRDAASLHDIDIVFANTYEQCAAADVIHAVNVTLPTVMQSSVRFASTLKKPLVVTTLYEDWSRYLDISHRTFSMLQRYVTGREQLDAVIHSISLAVPNDRGPRLDLSVLVDHCQALLASGEEEATRLKGDYPDLSESVQIVQFAVDQPLPADQKSIARMKHMLGFDQYVLCIGRLETRKNQLMLLAALQHEDIPIVFATGGYTPQPVYREAVLRWKRKAPVRFIERVPWNGLSVLIRGASLHALPSFYELPGLVHLECARAGIPIVASSWGGLCDYLPASAFHHCEPNDAATIRDAVHAALQGSASPLAAELASSYSLERLAESLGSAYDAALIRKRTTSHSHTCPVREYRSKEATGVLHVTA